MAVAETVPQTDEPVRDAFRAAFEDAKTQHATPAADVVDDVDDGDDPDPDDDDDATPVEGIVVPKAKTAVKPAAAAAPAADPDALVTDEEFAALQTTHANDPVALRKSLEGVFTQKTQKLAAERTTYERLKTFQPLIDAYEADAEGTLRTLADQAGFALAPKGKTPAAAPETTDAVEAVLADFKTQLGPELDYLADGLVPAITKLVEKLAQKEVAPLRAQQQERNQQIAAEQTTALLAEFTKTNPDWKTHEPAMMALSAKLIGDGTRPIQMTEPEYLNFLYQNVTHAAWEAGKAGIIEREANGRFKKLVARMNGAESGTDDSGTPETAVRKRPSGPVSFEQAAKDARAGIRYDD